jgi:hypothetical protein
MLAELLGVVMQLPCSSDGDRWTPLHLRPDGPICSDASVTDKRIGSAPSMVAVASTRNSRQFCAKISVRQPN